MDCMQGRALAELRELEETSAAVASAIQEAQLAKRALLDDLIEAERQIMLAERKIQLEKEMQVRRLAPVCSEVPFQIQFLQCFVAILSCSRPGVMQVHQWTVLPQCWN